MVCRAGGLGRKAGATGQAGHMDERQPELLSRLGLEVGDAFVDLAFPLLECLPGPDDAFLLATAMGSDAAWLAAGDHKTGLLQLKCIGSAAIVTPRRPCSIFGIEWLTPVRAHAQDQGMHQVTAAPGIARGTAFRWRHRTATFGPTKGARSFRQALPDQLQIKHGKSRVARCQRQHFYL